VYYFKNINPIRYLIVVESELNDFKKLVQSNKVDENYLLNEYRKIDTFLYGQNSLKIENIVLKKMRIELSNCLELIKNRKGVVING